MRQPLATAVCAIAADRSQRSRSVSAQTDVRLVTALKNQNTAAARALIRQRVDVNAPDVDGFDSAAVGGALERPRDRQGSSCGGAKPNAGNRYGVTPLHEAATIGSAAIVNALLRAGAQANAAYGEGETALMLAARSGNVESVKLLLEAVPT